MKIFYFNNKKKGQRPSKIVRYTNELYPIIPIQIQNI